MIKLFKNLKILGLSLVVIVVVVLVVIFFTKDKSIIRNQNEFMKQEATISLPEPVKDSEISVEAALAKRRSVREYKDEALTLKEISQVLWAAQGITEPQWGGRSAPSAGALYPLELYLVVRKAEGLEPGVYLYVPNGHSLNRRSEVDTSNELAQAALGQMFISKAPVSLVIAAFPERTSQKYGERAIRYVYMEAGHASQNVYLQVQSLGLGTVTEGAFDDERVSELLNLPAEEIPLYIMPIGKLVNKK